MLRERARLSLCVSPFLMTPASSRADVGDLSKKRSAVGNATSALAAIGSQRYQGQLRLDKSAADRVPWAGAVKSISTKAALARDQSRKALEGEAPKNGRGEWGWRFSPHHIQLTAQRKQLFAHRLYQFSTDLAGSCGTGVANSTRYRSGGKGYLAKGAMITNSTDILSRPMV